MDVLLLLLFLVLMDLDYFLSANHESYELTVVTSLNHFHYIDYKVIQFVVLMLLKLVNKKQYI